MCQVETSCWTKSEGMTGTGETHGRAEKSPKCIGDFIHTRQTENGILTLIQRLIHNAKSTKKGNSSSVEKNDTGQDSSQLTDLALLCKKPFSVGVFKVPCGVNLCRRIISLRFFHTQLSKGTRTLLKCLATCQCS